MDREQHSPEFWIISNQEIGDEERRRDEAIQSLDITNMDTITLEPVIRENQHMFGQIVEQVNLSRGPTITNYINFDLEVPENSTSLIVVEGRSANEYVSYRSRALMSIQNRISECPGRIRQSIMARRTDNVARSVGGPSTNSLFSSSMMPTTTTSSIIGNNQQTNGIEYQNNFMPFEIRSRRNYQTSRYVSSFNENRYQMPLGTDFNGDEMSIFMLNQPIHQYNQNNQRIYKFKSYFDSNSDINEYLFDIDEKEQENLTNDIICSICLNGPTEQNQDVSNDDENNLTYNKFCHLSCGDTHKFHSHCITTWLKQNLTCPCCRAIPEKNNLITSASKKINIGHVNSPMVYTNDPIIEQLRANGSRGITRLREISGMATQYINSHQQPGLPRIHRIHINSTNTSNRDIQSTAHIFNEISSRYLEILELNSHQLRPIDFVSQEINISSLETIQRPFTNTIEANDNVNNDEEDYSHIETFELEN